MSLKLTKVKQVTDAWERIQIKIAHTHTNTAQSIHHLFYEKTPKHTNMLQCQEGSMCLMARQTSRRFEYNY